MNTQPGGDSPLIFHPQGQVHDLGFCSSIPTYASFVREWRQLYRWLSSKIRHDKLEWRAAVSDTARPGNPRAARLAAQAKACDPGPKPPACLVNEAAWAAAPWRIVWPLPDIGHGRRCRFGDRAYANYLMELRRVAKQEFRKRVLTGHENEGPGAPAAARAPDGVPAPAGQP